MKQSQHMVGVLAETLLGSRAAAAMDHGIAAQGRGDAPGASEDAATASARGLCPAVRDAGTSRAVGDLCTPSPMQTIMRAYHPLGRAMPPAERIPNTRTGPAA